MENMTESTRFSKAFADEVLAEMARQRKTNRELAAVLNIGEHAAGGRINHRTPFTAFEMRVIADWLNLSVVELVERATTQAKRDGQAA